MTKSKYEIVTVNHASQEALVDRFHAGIYTDNFPGQNEPIDVWKWALFSGEAPYRMTLRLALEGDAIMGGVAYEVYPHSKCGLVTYVVVAPEARRGGIGNRLRTGAALAMYADGANAVFGEVNDPRVTRTFETPATTWKRLERNQRWGSRVVDTPYMQPSLGAGLERDRGLCLLLHAGEGPPKTHIPGEVVRDFIWELFQIAEKLARPDAELARILDAIPPKVRLLELVRPPDERGSRARIDTEAFRNDDRGSRTKIEPIVDNKVDTTVLHNEGRASRPRFEYLPQSDGRASRPNIETEPTTADRGSRSRIR